MNYYSTYEIQKIKRYRDILYPFSSINTSTNQVKWPFGSSSESITQSTIKNGRIVSKAIGTYPTVVTCYLFAGKTNFFFCHVMEPKYLLSGVQFMKHIVTLNFTDDQRYVTPALTQVHFPIGHYSFYPLSTGTPYYTLTPNYNFDGGTKIYTRSHEEWRPVRVAVKFNVPNTGKNNGGFYEAIRINTYDSIHHLDLTNPSITTNKIDNNVNAINIPIPPDHNYISMQPGDIAFTTRYTGGLRDRLNDNEPSYECGSIESINNKIFQLNPCKMDNEFIKNDALNFDVRQYTSQTSGNALLPQFLVKSMPYTDSQFVTDTNVAVKGLSWLYTPINPKFTPNKEYSDNLAHLISDSFDMIIIKFYLDEDSIIDVQGIRTNEYKICSDDKQIFSSNEPDVVNFNRDEYNHYLSYISEERIDPSYSHKLYYT